MFTVAINTEQQKVKNQDVLTVSLLTFFSSICCCFSAAAIISMSSTCEDVCVCSVWMCVCGVCVVCVCVCVCVCVGYCTSISTAPLVRTCIKASIIN